LGNLEPPIHEDRTDGVATFWTETPGPYIAILGFRVGHWDESIPNRGITHMVEHLALHPLRQANYEFNGTVAGDHLLFWVTGSEADVAGFMEAVCAQLRALSCDRLETEAGVLRAEAVQQGTHFADSLLGVHFGPNGPGLVALPEMGYQLVGPKELQTWADRHCTRQNAVLVLLGPTRLSLRLALADGEHRPFRIPGPECGYRPKKLEAVGEQEAGICLAGLTPRSSDSALAWEILELRLAERLRHELGLVYSVACGYRPLDAQCAWLFAGVDASRAEDVMPTAKEFMGVVRKMHREGPTEDELVRARARMRKEAEVDKIAFAQSEAQRAAFDWLFGYEASPWSLLLQEREESTPQSVRDAFREVIDHAMVVAPEPPKLRIPAREKEYPPPLAGGKFRPRGGSPEGIGRVVVGPEGISAEADARWINLRWNELVAVGRPDPQSWILESRTGAHLHFATNWFWWRRKLATLLEEHVPADLIVRNERGE
jgi:hypothetical protein